MDSIFRIQEPSASTRQGERRHRVRHRLHTPVYASFGEPQSGMVLDLSELLDIHEEGFAVHTTEPLEVNRPMTISLDLPEIKTYIHCSGHVVWTDNLGRGGIRFAALPAESRQLLHEWLFTNLLIGYTNQAARAEQLAGRVVEADASEKPSAPYETPAFPTPLESPLLPLSDLSSMLAALEAVRRELRAHDGDFNAALQLITDRALSLTGADGAALALLTGDQMICRARAGETAPPLGSGVDTGSGLSGECVRTGVLISCDDTETDPRVDVEICRALGIRSILAAPIVSNFRVVGLIEAFSSRRRAFGKAQEVALDRLAEIVPKAPVPPRPPSSMDPPPPSVSAGSSPNVTIETAAGEDAGRGLEAPVAWHSASGPAARTATPLASFGQSSDTIFPSTDELSEPVPSRVFYVGLMMATVAIAALVSGYLLAPTIQKYWWAAKASAGPSSAAASGPVSERVAPSARSGSVEELQKLAESGNPQSQYDLGGLYRDGHGVDQSDSEAAKWFMRAAENGNLPAQAALGEYYWIGRGVPQDLNKAYFWSVLARAQGDEGSKYRVALLTSQLTRAQAAAIQQQAEAWLHQHIQGAKLEQN